MHLIHLNFKLLEYTTYKGNFHPVTIHIFYSLTSFLGFVPPPLFTALLVASEEPVLAKKMMTEMLI